MNTVQKSAQILISTSTFLTLIASLISDILMPIAPLALYLGIVIVFMTIISLILYSIPTTRNFMSQLTSLWFMPMFIALNISYVILFTTFYYSDQAKEDRGVLAENADIIKRIQEHLHIVAADTKEIRKSIASVDAKMDNVKKETSTDPRKELANRGVEWSVNGYNNVLDLKDISSIKLFIEGGIDIFAKKNDKEIPPILILLANQQDGYKEIFKAAIKRGFDFNKKITTEMAIYNKRINQDIMREEFYFGYRDDLKKYFYNVCPYYLSAAEYLCYLPDDFSKEYLDILSDNGIDTKKCVYIRNKYIVELYKNQLKKLLEKAGEFTDGPLSLQEKAPLLYAMAERIKKYIEDENKIILRLKNYDN